MNDITAQLETADFVKPIRFAVVNLDAVETLPQVIGRLFLLVSAVFMCRSVAKE